MSDLLPNSAEMPNALTFGNVERSSAKPDLSSLRHNAEQFEAVFLTEMLKHTGLGAMTANFNGGPGEAAFSDFLTREYAEEIAKSRSTGIADQVFDLLRQRSGL
jgi:Rod binding domain-containing protein